MAEQAKEQKSVKKGSLEIVEETVREWFAYLQDNIRNLFFDLLKINLLASVVAGLILTIGLALFQFTPVDLTIKLAFLILFVIIGYFVQNGISSVVFNAVDERAKGSAVRIMAQAQQNFVPAVLFLILIGAIIFGMFLPTAISILLGVLLGSPFSFLIFFMISLLFFFLGLCALLVFVFLTQFSWWELIVNRRGLIESLKTSYSLITQGNIIKTLLVDIILLVIGGGFGIISSLFNYLEKMIAEPFSLVNSSTYYVILFILFFVFSLIISSVASTITLPLLYLFWKKLQKGS